MASGSEEMVSNKQVILKDYVNLGYPKDSDMFISSNLIELKVPEGSDGVLVKNLYFSCDAFMRMLMKDIKQRNEGFVKYKPGSPIYGFGVSKVIDSGNPNFSEGDFVCGLIKWEEYSLIASPTPSTLFKIHQMGLPLSYHIGILGMPGLTAYVGFYELGAPKKGEYVFVTSASGAIGHIVGQFAKLCGCYVVGSAGSKEKVDFLKNKFGFDEAFNYKEEHDIDATLKRYFPEGIDIYFDNVGGKMLDTVLLNMRFRGRIVMCGASSQECLEQFEGIFNIVQVILKSIHMKGFVVSDYYHLFPKYMEMIVPKIKEGRILYAEDIANGLDNAPAALVGLFTGRNIGKQVIKIADE